MNKALKTTIIIAGVAALGYFIYKKYKKPSETGVTSADLKIEEKIELGSAVDPSKSALLPEERA